VKGLVGAILSQHQTALNEELKPAFDALLSHDAPPTVRDIVSIWVHALGGELQHQSGRDFLRILPQVLHLVNPTVWRGGTAWPSATATTLALLGDCISDLPTPARRERLAAYALILTALFADRAALIESDVRPLLDDAQFAAHATDVICGAIEAPSTVRVRRTTKRAAGKTR
jgi:hypothetical protein